jgi:hypothetical protein
MVGHIDRHARPAPLWKELRMLAIAAVALFAIGFVINATSTHVQAVFDPFSLLLLGLACLALHMSGVGTGWRVPRGRGRRR